MVFSESKPKAIKSVIDISKDILKKVVDIQENLKNFPTTISAVKIPHENKQWTKIQLFNEIRKYLNPTLVALVRMEMFENCEEDYRADEKQVLKELLKLGSDVYEYVGSDWCFRLPPPELVREWLNDPEEIC